MTDDKYKCKRKDCKYFHSFNNHYSYANTCDYFFMTGQIRGGYCSECTKYEKGKKVMKKTPIIY